MKLIEMVHGSRLYQTHNDNSDYDYKGVAMPTARQILLGDIPKILERTSPKKDGEAKNRPGDVEREVYSLHYFIDLCIQGQTVAIDMLHAPQSAVTIGPHEWWAELMVNRHHFYTKKMTALVGYARHQAAKYGIKGSRLAAVKKVRQTIIDGLVRVKHPEATLGYLWDLLPDCEHTYRHEPSAEHNGIAMYEVCGMKLQATAKAAHYLPTLDKFISNYGERAKLAETNQGIDWKAVSHAFRAAFQMKAILEDGGFTYPLEQTAFLKDIKAGLVPYSEAGPQLESLIDQVERMAETSTWRNEPDKQWAYDFLERCSRAIIVGQENEIDSWYIQPEWT